MHLSLHLSFFVLSLSLSHILFLLLLSLSHILSLLFILSLFFFFSFRSLLRFRYTDAAFWDRMAGGLDERCADAWDVEPSDDDVSDGSDGAPRAPAMEQGTGLTAARHGIAGGTATGGNWAVRCCEHVAAHNAAGAWLLISIADHSFWAGRIMRSWGGCPTATPSSTFLDLDRKWNQMESDVRDAPPNLEQV